MLSCKMRSLRVDERSWYAMNAEGEIYTVSRDQHLQVNPTGGARISLSFGLRYGTGSGFLLGPFPLLALRGASA